MRWISRRSGAAVAAAALLAAALYLWTVLPSSILTADVGATRAWVQSFGIWAPAMLLLLQLVQVVVVPVPNQVLAAVAGYLFGAAPGTLITAVGTLVGGFIAFALGRWIGRPAVELFVPASTIDRCDAAVSKHGPTALIFLFLLPLFPGDVLCYTAGIGRMRFRIFAAVTLIGRGPKFILYSTAGDRLATSGVWSATLYLTPLLVLAAATLWQRDRIDRAVDRIDSWQGPNIRP